MKSLFFITLLAFSAPAFATSWYVFNGQNHSCEKATVAATNMNFPPYRSPYAYRMWARAHPKEYKGMGLHRMHSGLLVDFRIDNGRVLFMSTKSLCDFLAQRIGKITKIPNLNVLR